MQMMMSVLVVIIIALRMLIVLTLMVATTVHVILDILEMASTAQVYIPITLIGNMFCYKVPEIVRLAWIIHSLIMYKLHTCFILYFRC